MNEFLGKISSYDLFNNLLPGIVFSSFLKMSLNIQVSQSDLIVDLFIFYFIGMIIGRFGSLVIEKSLKAISWKKRKLVEFYPYQDYLKAVDEDKKIELFVEICNTYRSLAAMLFLMVLIQLFKIIENILYYWGVWENLFQIPTFLLFFLFCALFILFVFSYKKQVSMIKKRILYK